VIRTLREMEIASVAVYSDADRLSEHVRMADYAEHIGPAPATDAPRRTAIQIPAMPDNMNPTSKPATTRPAASAPDNK